MTNIHLEHKKLKTWLSIFRALMSIDTIDLMQLQQAIHRELERRLKEEGKL